MVRLDDALRGTCRGAGGRRSPDAVRRDGSMQDGNGSWPRCRPEADECHGSSTDAIRYFRTSAPRSSGTSGGGASGSPELRKRSRSSSDSQRS